MSCLNMSCQQRSPRLFLNTLHLTLGALLCLLPSSAFADSMKKMSGPNRLVNGRFENVGTVTYPWTGVDRFGNLRKSVQDMGVNLYVSRSNQFDYAFLPNSASFVDMNADGLPDLVSPDGSGFFWFWQNIGKPGEPKFGLGEVMPLLVDNDRSRFRNREKAQQEELSTSQKNEKERVDRRRAEEFEKLQKKNDKREMHERLSEEQMRKMVAEAKPYSWEREEENLRPDNSICVTNGYRQLRSVAAPCDWDANGTPDFLVGDAQGTLYLALNTGRRGFPNFRTYTKDKDRIVLKLALQYNQVSRKNTYEPVEFMNYAMPFVCDWNGNGKPDILVGEGTYSTNAIRLFLDPQPASLRTGTFPKEHALYVGDDRTFLAPTAWDWDGDGFLDLIVADGDGRITIHPNRNGAYMSGDKEMTDFMDLEIEGDDKFLTKFMVPQACDWNADGVMDLIWSGPFGRILYSLGKELGGTQFGPIQVVKSELPDKVRQYPFPHSVSMAAVPTANDIPGGTAGAQRYFTQAGQDIVNKGGWPGRQFGWWGLMPQFDPLNMTSRIEKFIHDNLAEGKGINFGKLQNSEGLIPSWAIAPVPYEVFEVIDERPDGNNGEGDKTLQLTWHNPNSNRIFRQPRDQPTPFGVGVSYSFPSTRADKLGKTAPLEPWMTNNLHKGNVRISFFMKLEGSFSKLTVLYKSRFYIEEIRKAGDGGKVFGPTMSPPPNGRWFHYEAVVGPGDRPRTRGSLWVHLTGRGDVWIRDVAVADTEEPPAPRRGRR